MTLTLNHDHPAKFSAPILEALAGYIGSFAAAGPYITGPVTVLDPFAGVGTIHRLADPADRLFIPDVVTYGVELEPEWAGHHPRTVVGDACQLPFAASSIDIVATSPCYGNRMADDHEAKDPCKTCKGSGCAWPDCSGAPAHLSPVPEVLESHTVCSVCKGLGLSRRNTYKHRLGRNLTPGSAGRLRFTTPAYKRLHTAAWAEAHRVLRPYGLAIINVSNFENDGKVQRAVEWHLSTLLHLGFHLEAIEPIQTRRLKQGANWDLRQPFEFVLVVRRVS